MLLKGSPVVVGESCAESHDAVSDDVWAVIGPLFPAVKSTGRPPVDRRTVVEATAWRYRTGASWTGSPRSIPPSCGCTSTVPRCRASRGEEDRTARGSTLSRSITRSAVPWGWTTKAHLVADGRWRPLAFVLTPGQTADTSMLAATLDQIRVPGPAGRPRTRPDRHIVDKGYPSRANRA